MSGQQSTFFKVVNNERGVAEIRDRQFLESSTMAAPGWNITGISAAGLEISVFRIAPGAVYPSHVGPLDCVCFVAEGGGELFLADAQGNELQSVLCRRGDSYLQCANTLHGFRNGLQETVLVYMQVA
jgi:hypothetical protein